MKSTVTFPQCFMSSAAVVGGWCILFYQVQNQHRTYKKLYLLREDADFLFITVFDSLAIPPDLNPTEFSIISVLSGTLWEKHLTQKYRQAEGCYQSNLGFSIMSAVLLADCLYAMLQSCSNLWKGSPS